jgi:ATP phosphoribosyltransferase
MNADPASPIVRLALPKGRMERNVFELLADAGINIHVGSRAYRPSVSMAGFDTKILKPQNIVEMLHVGSRDIGFAGADWVSELGVDVVDLLNTEFDPVRLVAAAPAALLQDGKLPNRLLLAATEYERLVSAWVRERGLNARVVRTFGATEVFPPEDADFIVDVAASGATLAANGLEVFDELLRSSTRLFACPRSMDDASKRESIERFVMLLRSVLEARSRVMLEVNVPADRLEAIVRLLPCMREPTVARLHGDAGYAVKVAILRKRLPELIPEVKRHGGTDIVVSKLSQIVP